MTSLLVFNRVYRLDIQLVIMVFSTPLVNYRPSTFSLVHLPPFPMFYTFYTVCNREGEGMGLRGEHIQK
jgi:hypothetical protein